jgi:choline kinase
MGTRLGDLTSNRPKCLVEVRGTPILANTLTRLAHAGVTGSVLVVGYRGTDVRACIGVDVGGMRVSYRENPDYRTTSTSRSLQLGLQGIEDEVLVIEGDVFFDALTLSDLVEGPHQNATLVERWRPDIDGSVVTVDRMGVVSAWIHTKDRPAGLVLTETFKTVNLHRLSASLLQSSVKPALDAQVARDPTQPLERVFGDLVRRGARIHATPVRGRWVEIDDGADLSAAERLFGAGGNGPR